MFPLSSPRSVSEGCARPLWRVKGDRARLSVVRPEYAAHLIEEGDVDLALSFFVAARGLSPRTLWGRRHAERAVDLIVDVASLSLVVLADAQDRDLVFGGEAEDDPPVAGHALEVRAAEVIDAGAGEPVVAGLAATVREVRLECPDAFLEVSP